MTVRQHLRFNENTIIPGNGCPVGVHMYDSQLMLVHP